MFISLVIPPDPSDAEGADGALWFVEQFTSRIGRITTAGVSTEFVIPTPGSQPVGIAAGPDGAMWFTSLATNRIGRVAMDGTITEFPLPAPNRQPNSIVAGPDGAMWFTELVGNRLGRITTAGIDVKLSDSPYGDAYLGYARLSSETPLRVGEGLEVLHSIAGWNPRPMYTTNDASRRRPTSFGLSSRSCGSAPGGVRSSTSVPGAATCRAANERG